MVASPAQTGAIPGFGQSFAGAVPFGGRAVPLPEGTWVVVAANTGATPAGDPRGGAVLARIDGPRVLGLVLVTGALGPDPARRGFPAEHARQRPGKLYARVISAVDHGPQDSWCIESVLGAD